MLPAVVAGLERDGVPRALAHVKVVNALLEWAKERGGDLLERKCWTVACIAHASTGAVALDAPADVTQVLMTTRRAVAIELALVQSLDVDFDEQDPARVSAMGSIEALRRLEYQLGEDEALHRSTTQPDIEVENVLLLMGNAASKRRAAFAAEQPGLAGAGGVVVMWAAALEGSREGAKNFIASLREVLLHTATAQSMQEFLSAVLGPSMLQGGQVQ